MSCPKCQVYRAHVAEVVGEPWMRICDADSCFEGCSTPNLGSLEEIPKYEKLREPWMRIYDSDLCFEGYLIPKPGTGFLEAILEIPMIEAQREN